MKVQFNVSSEGTLSIDIIDFLNQLPDEQINRILEFFTFDQIIPAIEKQLKHGTELYSITYDGKDGHKIREAIIKIQGLEPEFKKDLELQIDTLERENKNYKKYYDWYWKLYHFSGSGRSDYSLYNNVISMIGKPEDQVGE